MTLHAIIMGLIEAGAHMDTVNSQGKTPYDAATTGLLRINFILVLSIYLVYYFLYLIKLFNLEREREGRIFFTIN